MGNEISSSIPPSLSLSDTLIDGDLDLTRYYMHKRNLRLKEFQRTSLNALIHRKRKIMNNLLGTDNDLTKNSIRKKRSKKNHLWIRDSNGELKKCMPTDSLWFKLYLDGANVTPYGCKLFRRRFRLPFYIFMELLDDVTEHKLFSRWTKNNCAGAPPSNIGLLLLGTLRCIGRGCTFDDIEEATGISIDVIRDFFHIFIMCGSTVLYEKHVTIPARTTKPSEFEELFASAGFNGCIGSTDATNIPMLKCAIWAAINHKGHKLNVPSRTYNLTVNHCRQILGSTMGHPCAWNDKTVTLYDELVRGVKDGVLFSDYEFKLYEYDENNNVIEVVYVGVWFMVDNGYLSWSCTVPPMKDGVSYLFIRFSEWLESMRKDAECTFGIMKGRFCSLRYGLRMQSIEKCDQIWLTCCALHNRLLFEDGLNKDWMNGEKSDWEREFVQHSKRSSSVFAYNRLFANKNQDNDVLMNGSNLVTRNKRCFKKHTVNGKRIVRKMPLRVFRERLVEHFDIRFRVKQDIAWPKRFKTTPSVI